MALGEMRRDDMAELLGVNPATVSRWMADKGAPPKRAYLMQWAMATDVPFTWLAGGEVGPGPKGGVSIDTCEYAYTAQHSDKGLAA